MTLTEYINQYEALRGNVVNLFSDEYRFGRTINIAGHPVLKDVFIISEAFYSAFPECSGEYVMMGNNPQLYTVDQDGNPKSLSCFYL